MASSTPLLFLSHPPFSERMVIRFLLLLVIVLSVLAGHYSYALSLEQKKYSRLEDRYVRVRGQLGVDETQRLIDQSHEIQALE
jgi:hypothetical protein